MIRQPIPAWLFWSLAVSGIVVAIAIYAGMSVYQTRINPTQSVIPGLKGFAEGFDLITKPRGNDKNPKPSWLVTDSKVTFSRLFIGMGLGTIAAIVLGIAMGAYTGVEAFFSPIISFMAKIPPTGMLVIYMVAFGTNFKMFIALIGFGIFFTMVQSIYQSVKKDVASDHIDKAYTLGASEFEVVLEVIWKQILPRVIDNIRLHIGPALVFLIAAEMLFASEGFGYTIRQSQRFSNMNVVYIYLGILGTVGLLLDYGLMRFRRWLCPWFGE
ncbi:MAG: ABC transporter permease subunit [bacterium]|nr:ABC transporter permease subunit [bacterium]